MSPLRHESDPQDRVRISDWTYQRLLAAIRDGELVPGERLSVPSLAAELGISRSPVREAVQRLVREGLGVEEPHRGAVVAEVSRAQLQVIYEVREVLEGLAARVAAERMSDEEIAALREQWERHAAVIEAGVNGRVERHIELDQDFHSRIRRATGNPWLVDYLDRLRSLVHLAMTSTSFTAGPDDAIRDHRQILEAIEARDPDAAEAASRRHIERLRHALRDRAETEDG